MFFLPSQAAEMFGVCLDFQKQFWFWELDWRSLLEEIFTGPKVISESDTELESGTNMSSKCMITIILRPNHFFSIGLPANNFTGYLVRNKSPSWWIYVEIKFGLYFVNRLRSLSLIVLWNSLCWYIIQSLGTGYCIAIFVLHPPNHWLHLNTIEKSRYKCRVTYQISDAVSI